MSLDKEREKSDWERNWTVQTRPCPWEGSEFPTEPMAIGPTLECASNVMRWKRRKRGQGGGGIISSGEGSKAKV